ncbi:MAG: DUF1287 domain-containing protein [Eubacteriales bacterium]|nr:DUF1287 domain-containing protein [Eubacteriales bacterium]
MRRRITISICILALAVILSGCAEKGPNTKNSGNSGGFDDYFDSQSSKYPEQSETTIDNRECKLDIPKLIIKSDKDEDGLTDLDDILEGARIDMENKPVYKSVYYAGGYPPDNEGVCTDVVWRAMKNAGYDLKSMIDKDIRDNTELYPRVEGNPDPNIDFRRVKNLIPFFKRFATKLTDEIIPNDIDNLAEWQAGDIVIFGAPLDHIAVVSDRRNPEGVPYIIHNSGPYTMENDSLLSWPSSLIYHFRFPKDVE